MKILKQIIVLSVMLLVCACTVHITTVYEEPETTVAAIEEVTTETTEAAATEDTEVTHTYQGYIIVLLSALFGALVAYGFWHVLGA